jgi:O-methyltransferase
MTDAHSQANLSRDDSGFRRYIDRCNVDAVMGWVTHSSGIREIRVYGNGKLVGKSVWGLARPDVSIAEGDIPYGAKSGFAFAFPDGTFTDSQPQATIDVEFEAADGTVDRDTRLILALRVDSPTMPCRVADAQLSPFPCNVLSVLRRARPERYSEQGLWSNALVCSAIDDLVAMLQQRAPVKPVIHYALYLKSMANAFYFITEHFDRINRLSTPTLKDNCAVATSPEEMLCIANHLYLLRSYGLAGNLVECGCFKGFSSCCLSQACAALNIHMDVFDSFAGLPPSDSIGYEEGEFCGSIDEVEDNLRTFGRPEVVSLHKGFFSKTLPTYHDRVLTIWMDVDLASSASDVMQLLPKLPHASCVFTHECPPQSFVDGRPVRDGTEVLPPIVDAFAADGRQIWGKSVTGALGLLLEPTRGLPVLDLDWILALVKAS